MVANNMRELEAMIMKRMRDAMSVTSKKVLADMHEETGKFYTQGTPKQYKRTGALGDTPNTTSVRSSGKEVSFNAYLDTSHQYTTGDNPSMDKVLNLANYGRSWTTKNGKKALSTLGKKGFWEASEEKIQKTLDDTFKNFFK